MGICYFTLQIKDSNNLAKAIKPKKHAFFTFQNKAVKTSVYILINICLSFLKTARIKILNLTKIV